MRSLALIAQYSAQVMAWQLGNAPDQAPLVEDREAVRHAAERVARLAAQTRHNHVVVLGLGDGTLGYMLSALLPPHCHLVILEESPAVARKVQAQCPSLPYSLLVDTSPWAMLLLTVAAGLHPDRCLVCRNPVYKKEGKTSGGFSVLEKWRRLFMGSSTQYLPHSLPDPAPRLSVACIADPEEILLSDFFEQIPSWVAEVVVVWDGAAPAQLPPCTAPLRQLVRPLDENFAAQRNAMLELCQGDWCLYLDMDERLDGPTWEALRHWMLPQAGGVLLPRLTFMGDCSHARMGYGLWPDMQVRLFPLHKNLEFTGAVHEKLTGLSGELLLAGGLNVLHFSHVTKSRAMLAARLELFDKASERADTESKGESGNASSPRIEHVLSDAYPRLPMDFFDRISDLFGRKRALVLPDMT